MTLYNFVPPVAEEGPIGEHRLFMFYRMNKGITIVRNTKGQYSQVRYLVDEDKSNYPEIYLGGRNHTVDADTKARLIAAGVGVTEDNFTEL
jgi:hypothetical protein